jgi:hypothetical protein
MLAAAIMLARSQHTYWQLREALDLEALVAGKGPVINIKPAVTQNLNKLTFSLLNY